MTPELDPCFYYISVRGFDRILTISSHLFGGFIEITNQVDIHFLEGFQFRMNFRTHLRNTVALSDLRFGNLSYITMIVNNT